MLSRDRLSYRRVVFGLELLFTVTMDLSDHSEVYEYVSDYCFVLLDKLTVLLEYIACFHS